VFITKRQIEPCGRVKVCERVIVTCWVWMVSTVAVRLFVRGSPASE
jgi:hypothetical protein